MKVGKIVGGGLALFAVVGLGGFTFLSAARPIARPASTEVVERTPVRLARGRYLAETVIGCMDCHSKHRDDLYGWPAIPATYGQGGFSFDQKLGLPGVIQAQNITSDPETGIGSWTDGEVMRAIREGVARNGRALFPMMPYEQLRALSDEDTRSVVVYLRSLPPIKKAIPDPVLDFPVSLLVRLSPQPVDGPVPDVKQEDHLALGKYLVTISSCVVCHTNQVRGRPVKGMEYAGGWVLEMPWGRLVTPNITPDPETGIGNMTKEAFIGRVKSFASLGEVPAPKARNTIMPWLEFAHMPEEELGAIYDYLRTVPPVKNKIENVFPDAPT